MLNTCCDSNGLDQIFSLTFNNFLLSFNGAMFPDVTSSGKFQLNK